MNLEELKKAITENRGVAELPHFIAFGGDLNVRFPDSDSTLLHLAIEFENLPMMKALFNAGADLEARDSNGWTPIHHAVEFDLDAAGQADYTEGAFLRHLTFAVTALLASFGADLNSQIEDGSTPRDLASKYGETVLQKYDQAIAKATQ
jgi:ankyrin repeat protein